MALRVKIIAMKTVNPIHRSQELHRDAGTFYSTYYADASRVFTLFDSMSWANQLLLDDALDAAKLFVRTLIPPVHRERFLPIRVDEREYREGRRKIPTYGQENLRYGDGYHYGHPAATITGAVELPPDVVDVDLCCEMPVDPNIVLVKNEHFFLHGGRLFFSPDLFDVLPPSEETDGNRSVVIYLRGVSIDRKSMQNRLGVLTRAAGPSTQEYVDFCNLVMDSVQEGTSLHKLSQMICKLYDVPCTSETETVECTGVTEHARWLATNRAVYTAPHAAKFTVSPGETIRAGTILTDAIRAIRGRDFPEGLPLVLERRFLGREYSAGLVFPNEEMPVTIPPGFRYPVFPVIGREDDVCLFWETFYARAGDPAVLSRTGPTVNPARFLYDKVLYPRLQFYYMDLGKTGPNRLPVTNTNLFRGLMPPGVLFSLLVLSKKPAFDTDLLEFAGRSKFGVAAKTIRGAIPFTAENFQTKRC